MKIAIIGDVMLDRHIACQITGYSPEDDLTPKLRVTSERYNPGGAANVAINLRYLGCQNIHLFGIIGDDQSGLQLKNSLQHEAINGILLKIRNRPTTTKTRYITPRGRHAVRIDKEITDSIDDKSIIPLIYQIKDTAPYDCIIISDYAKGLITEQLLKAINALNILTIVDPKGMNFIKYGEVYAITPNELEHMAAIKQQNIAPNNAKNYIITKSKNGCTLIKNNNITTNFPVKTREIGDPTGCGDTFIAALALSIAKNKSIEEACKYAVAAGACAVDHEGVYAVTHKEVLEELNTQFYKD
jgi:rfaE bifunctional protein kinase chain/domain